MGLQIVCDQELNKDVAWPSFPVVLREAVGAQVGTVLYAGLGTAGHAWFGLDMRLAPKSWQRLADFPAAVPSGAVSVVVEGKVYVFGGAGRISASDSLAQFDVVHCYDPLSDSWTCLSTHLPCGLLGASAACVDDRHILFFGGYNATQFNALFARYKALAPSQQPQALEAFMARSAQDYAWNGSVWQFNVVTLNWKNLGAVGHLPNCGSSVIQHQGQIYLLSGEVKPGLRSDSVKRAMFADGSVKWIDEARLPPVSALAPQEGVACGFSGCWGTYPILAGGTNFPGARRRYDAGEFYAHQGLPKTWRNEIYVFRDDVWIMAGRLPVARANGLSFQVAAGLVFVGGDTQDGVPCMDTLFLAHPDTTAPSTVPDFFQRDSSDN
ncbi:YjhT family mutarotase [Glaciimonas sp. PCH181]|uniref:YjhT family mutarotase n=1 Tax=Glaciimonas sp. PCH181 TaxID=2133943 RepID=UPI000D3AE812|nr:YjhT family mutarotase [Glaciimonas sp. PCH181]PUA20374.1 hypothetical protein C7W93_11630 [Glaciimonas sp. PCH181]